MLFLTIFLSSIFLSSCPRPRKLAVRLRHDQSCTMPPATTRSHLGWRNTMRISLYCLRGLPFVVALVSVAATLGAPNEVKISELAPGVYFRKAQTEPKFTGCNQGWVVFKDYVLVIDANFPGQAEEVIKVIRKYTDKPLRFVF